MKNKSKHLTKEERFFIDKMLSTNKSISYIAKLLERGVSTISEEVARNGGISGYNSNKAQSEALKRQLNKKVVHNKVVSNKHIRKLVDKHLSTGLSAEKISDLLGLKYKNQYVSSKSIRKYVGYKNKNIL